MKTKNSTYLRWTFLLLWLAAGNYNSYSQNSRFVLEDRGRLFPETLGTFFRNYSVYELNPETIAAYVSAQSPSARFTLQVGHTSYPMNIEINEMRSANYEAYVLTEGGAMSVNQKPATTYKGTVNESPENFVRLNIDHSAFEGYFKVGENWYYLDMLYRYIKNADKNKIVLYNAKDVINTGSTICGANLVHKENQGIQNEIQATGNCHFLEIATEADYEYFQAFSNNADSALSRIRTILNLVEGLYTSSFDVKFILRYQQIWATAADPYVGDSVQVILPQFMNWWNTNKTAIQRDVAQMFMGRTLLNASAGMAYIGTVCGSFGYGCVGHLSPVTNSTIILSAHELAHNFGANHDTACNGNNIMCFYYQTGTPQWSQQSLTEINSFVSASGNCMTETFPVNAVLTGSSIPSSYLKQLATSGITINSNGGPVQISNNGFGYLEAGSSIVIAPTAANSVGFIAPQGSYLRMRISNVATNCDVATRTTLSESNSRTDQFPGMSVFPNPFKSTITVSVNLEKEGAASITLYDMMGKVVLPVVKSTFSEGLHEMKLETPGLPLGVYLLVFQTEGFRAERKVLKLE